MRPSDPRSADIVRMNSTLKEHLASPEVLLDGHVRRRHSELARKLETRQAIYLDQKFWIALRQIAAAKHPTADQRELLDLLRTRVSTGRAFCPISESTFIELLKQEDHKSREATARLIDELSLGVSLIPFDIRMCIEIEHFIYAEGGWNGLAPLRHRIWSKLSYVLGLIHPTRTAFDPSTELAIQKAFFDHMWTTSLLEVIRTIGDGMPKDAQHIDLLATRLNEGNRQRAQDLRSFQQTYGIELRGGLELMAPVAANALRQMTEHATGKTAAREGAEWDALMQKAHALLVAAFKKNKSQDTLRTLHINSCLHAAFRWDKKQQLEANDFHDFRHAAAALGYCNVFLTEEGLKSMVTAKHLALDQQYGCKVAAKMEDAIAILHRLA